MEEFSCVVGERVGAELLLVRGRALGIVRPALSEEMVVVAQPRFIAGEKT